MRLVNYFLIAVLVALFSTLSVGCKEDPVEDDGPGDDSDSATESNTDTDTMDDTDSGTESPQDSDTTEQCGGDWDGTDVSCYGEGGCFSFAMDGPCLAEYNACQDDTDCAAYETCRNVNCVDSDLTGPDWVECEQDCADQSAEESVAKYTAFEDCANCTACPCSCGTEVGIVCPDKDCDAESTSCYDEADGCWGCAMNLDCKEEVAACTGSTDCTSLESCLTVNCVEPGHTGEDWTNCVASCEAANPDGVGLLNAYHDCIYCVGCPNACATDAGGRCK